MFSFVSRGTYASFHPQIVLDAHTSDWKQGLRVIDTSKGTSTFDLIGGPEEINPSSWQTETHSATSTEKKTSIDQLTETGRSMHVRGKKSSIPAYENMSPFSESVASRLRDENPYSLNEGSNAVSWPKTPPELCSDDKENLIGYRAPRAGDSFLSGLGKDLADRL
jgi:hypothetical protein